MYKKWNIIDDPTIECIKGKLAYTFLSEHVSMLVFLDTKRDFTGTGIEEYFKPCNPYNGLNLEAFCYANFFTGRVRRLGVMTELLPFFRKSKLINYLLHNRAFYSSYDFKEKKRYLIRPKSTTCIFFNLDNYSSFWEYKNNA